jgi:xanthine/uracil permease
MFGMIAATGIRILSTVELTPDKLNVIAISIGVGMIPILSEDFFQFLPSSLAPLLHSGIVLAAITSVLLNLLFVSTSRCSSEGPEPGEPRDKPAAF